jgi:hypothetical protein
MKQRKENKGCVRRWLLRGEGMEKEEKVKRK